MTDSTITDSTILEPRFCKNCSSQLQGDFCSACGQADKNVRRPLLNLLKELVQVIFELDGRAYRTLFFLFTRPGYLYKEYVEGRRASYTPPLRLFLILSIVLFFSISFTSFIDELDSSVANTEPGPGLEIVDPDVDSQAIASSNDSETTDDSSVNADAEDLATDLEEVEEILSAIAVPFLNSADNSRLSKFLISQTQTNYRRIREDPTDFIYGSLEYITVFLLIMMPLMAVTQGILYIRSKRYYVEHFVLTLHNHTFLVLAVLVGFPLGAAESSSLWLINGPAGLLSIALNIWMVVYLFLSMKRFYGGGYLLTTLKFITATVTYAVLLAAGLAIFMAINFILF